MPIGVGDPLPGYPVTPVPIYPPPPPPAPARWTFGVGPWTGLPDTGLSRLTGRSVTWRLTGLHEASFTVDGMLPEAASIHELITDLWVFRDGQALYRGRVGAATDTGDDKAQTCSFSTAAYPALLARRLILDGDTLVYAVADKAAIAWALIAQTQGKAGGSLGLVRGTGTAPATTASSTYQPGTTVSDMVNQLAQSSAGFDWDLTPSSGAATQTFDVWPARGVDRGKVVDYPGQLQAYTRTVDPGQFANVIRATGATGLAPLTVTATGILTDPAGRFEAQSGDTNILTTSALAAAAAKQLTDGQTVVPSWTVTIAPGRWGGPDDVWLGDPVTLAVQHGRLDVLQTLRVAEIGLSLDDSDVETVTLTLGTPPPAGRWLLRHLDKRLTALERR